MCSQPLIDCLQAYSQKGTSLGEKGSDARRPLLLACFSLNLFSNKISHNCLTDAEKWESSECFGGWFRTADLSIGRSPKGALLTMIDSEPRSAPTSALHALNRHHTTYEARAGVHPFPSFVASGYLARRPKSRFSRGAGGRRRPVAAIKAARPSSEPALNIGCLMIITRVVLAGAGVVVAALVIWAIRIRSSRIAGIRHPVSERRNPCRSESIDRPVHDSRDVGVAVTKRERRKGEDRRDRPMHRSP